MAEQQLVEYIKKAKAAGQPDQQTRSLLIKNGWTELEVNDAFAAQQPQAQAQPRPQPQAQPQFQMPQQPQPQFQQPKQTFQQPQQAQARPVAQPQQQPQAQYPQRNLRENRGNPVMGLVLVLLILAILGTGGYFTYQNLDYLKGLVGLNSVVVKNNNQTTTDSSAIPVFANYNLASTKYVPTLPNYTLKIEDIANLTDFEKAAGATFSLGQKNALTQDNFFVAKNGDKFYASGADDFTTRNDDWTALYKTIGGSYSPAERQQQNSVYISSDFVLHVYHKLVDEEFQFIEESNFYPALANLSKSMLASAAKNYAQVSAQDQKDSFDRLSAYFLVSSAILDNASADYAKFKQTNFIENSTVDSKTAVLAAADALAQTNAVSENAKNIAKQEIGLIFDAKDMVESPLMGKFQPSMKEDYSQFGPRSHYAKNAILRDYFRAMMWYGRMNFLLKSPELTRDASNITTLLTPDLKTQWESIYQPTTFFVGTADDLTIYDYVNAQKKTGSDIGKLQQELLTYRNPKIMSSVIVNPSVTSTSKEDLQNTTKGFRFMGQRFTPDAFVFSTLTQGDEAPDPKTGQKLPSTPTALMVSTLMGSSESATLLNKWIQDNAKDSDKVLADRMATLQDYFGKTTQAQWTQNIYWSWLYTIKSLFANTKTAGYPMFMKSENWDKKSLQAFLGSWTELKHDTLLYAKQSYAELGAGGPEDQPAKAVVKGYVEPNVEFYDRLIALVNMTKDGLKSFGILPADFEQRNNTFAQTLAFYKQLAVAELQNQTISDDDFEKLRLSAGQLDNILSAPDSQEKVEKNARAAIIADVHTDAKKGQILYEGDGIPNYVFVAVKDANGTRLTKGLVYSYYEFAGQLGKRLTDETWQKINYSASSKNLIMPWWNTELIK